MDNRVNRTKELLSGALFALLQRAPMEQISILSICRRAMVHRTTFYKYFENKQQLLFYYFDSVLSDMEKTLTQSDSKKIQSFFMLCIDYVDSKRAAFTNLNSNNLQYLHSFFNSLFRQKMLENSNRFMTNPPRDACIDFFAGGIVSILISWVQSDYKDGKQQIIDQFKEIANKFKSDIFVAY